MERYEIDGMTVDQMFYWFDQPAVYLGRVSGGDDRPCLVLLVSDVEGTAVYHRLRFETERGMRATLAAGVAATPATYAMAQDTARLVSVDGEGEWVDTGYDRLLEVDGGGTKLPPSRSSGDIPMKEWSKDHWSLLVTLANVHRSTNVPELPVMDYDRMRINPANHFVHLDRSDGPEAYEAWDQTKGTMLRRPGPDTKEPRPGEADGQISYHDDFDCVEELEAEGLLDIVSTAAGTYEMTVEGLALAKRVEAHVSAGIPIVEFEPMAMDDCTKASTQKENG